MIQDVTTNLDAGAPGVAVIGTGYVGTVAAVAFATVGWRVVGIESDPAKLAALFTFGVLYGTIVSHLHDTRQLAAVHVRGVDRESWFYMTTWGIAGVALGSLLPYVDLVWGGRRGSSALSSSGGAEAGEEGEKEAESPISEQINDVVRSVAAFLGVAFAIVSPRTLPTHHAIRR